MTRPEDPRTAAARMFAEAGAFGELLAGIEWAATPLGPPESWPGPLVDTLRLMLTSEHGMALYWGPEFATLYNLGAALIPGAKHPWALGKPYKEVFPEVWAPVSSHFHYVIDTRKSMLISDEPLIMERHGFPEQCYFDSSFQPVLLDDGTAGGVLQILTETTGRVLGERRLRLLSEAGARTAGLPTPGEVARVVAEVLGSYPEEIPFLGLYLASEPGCCGRLPPPGSSRRPRPSRRVPPTGRRSQPGWRRWSPTVPLPRCLLPRSPEATRPGGTPRPPDSRSSRCWLCRWTVRARWEASWRWVSTPASLRPGHTGTSWKCSPPPWPGR
ncbi:hypothetical protein [Streptomyces sp. CA-179760]|uniref:hypothetical protein n=1 Tax=Streptomyces sp. CA-179760 TaxID=3240054 RepID=UPI003D94FB0B